MAPGLQVADLKIGETYRFEVVSEGGSRGVVGDLDDWSVDGAGVVRLDVIPADGIPAVISFDPAEARWEITRVGE